MSSRAHAAPSAEEEIPLDNEARRKGALEVDKLFRLVVTKGGSDLHLKTGKPPMMRYKGDILTFEQLGYKVPILDSRNMEKLLMPMMNERLRRIHERDGGADFAHVVTIE